MSKLTDAQAMGITLNTYPTEYAMLTERCEMAITMGAPRSTLTRPFVAYCRAIADGNYGQAEGACQKINGILKDARLAQWKAEQNASMANPTIGLPL